MGTLKGFSKFMSEESPKQVAIIPGIRNAVAVSTSDHRFAVYTDDFILYVIDEDLKVQIVLHRELRTF